jgi:hypothetical protein
MVLGARQMITAFGLWRTADGKKQENDLPD